MRPEIIVLATRNAHKIMELQDVLSGLGVQLQSAYDFVELPDVEEDLDTLEGNALKKARVTFSITGLPSLSDDTGLEVDALDGQPGVYSARFAGIGATYDDNVRKLILDLKTYHANHPNFDGFFTARFRTVIAYVTSEEEYLFHGVCEGQIILTKKGSNGFGYDPVFIPLGYEQTFAEMDSNLKNKISHRSLATQKFKMHLVNEKS